MKHLVLAIILISCMSVEARTFGKTDVGASQVTHSTTTERRAASGGSHTYTALATDTIKYIHLYYASNGGDDFIKTAVYTVSGGNAANRTGSVAQLPNGPSFPTFNWDSVAVTIPLSEGTEYCLALGEVGGGGTINIYIKTTTGSSGDTDEGASATLTSAWGIIHTDRSHNFSLYATLNDLAAPTGPPNTVHGPGGQGNVHGAAGQSSVHEP